MMLRQISRDLIRRLPEWDTPTKLSLAIAVVLLFLLLSLGFFGPPEVQFPARVGAFGLLLSLQLLFLWANRREISPYHQAQQHFIAGDYQAAHALLEEIPDSGRQSVDALVLLGNTYRHLRLYDKSRLALERALALKADHHLGLFSMGKLQLVSGEYAAARDYIARALAAGAPDIVKFELGQCCFLLGDNSAAEQHFIDVHDLLVEQPAQSLLLQYYLYLMDAADRPSDYLIEQNLSALRDEALSHRGSPYGTQIQEASERMGEWLGEA